MAGGISPNRIITIPLEDYNSDHYLTLIYQAMLNRGWHIGYFDHDGIIAYTNISWASYSEEVSARIIGNSVIIKSECVGYQGLFTDYGKNKKNLTRLLDEIIYAEFQLQNDLEQTTQELMNAVPEKQFLSLEDPPMAGKEQLRGFFSPVIPRKKYLITPLLVIINTFMFFLTIALIRFFPLLLNYYKIPLYKNIDTKVYLLLGVNNRTDVLNGELWRLLTSTFLHFSLLHLLGNMIVLVYIGSLIESKLGKWNYLLMYLFTGIIASTASIIWNSAEISAGASGAIFGLFGILLALLSTDFYERSARKALLISTAIFVTYSIIPVGEGIDHAAHFGGLIAGYLFGWMAYAGFNHKKLFIKKWGIALIGSAVVIVFVSCGVLFNPQYQTEEFEALIQKTEKMNREITSEFYDNNEGFSREKRLAIIEDEALPEVKNLKKEANKFNNLVLPGKKKREAKAWATLINLQSRYYQLLYLEFREQDRTRYRPEIDSITNQINKVRFGWDK